MQLKHIIQIYIVLQNILQIFYLINRRINEKIEKIKASKKFRNVDLNPIKDML